MNTQVKQSHRTFRKQAGGTFLGLILGLIVGLGIAVVVALMITKSPIPFVNKVTKQERTELSPVQAADPNKPLYGNKDAARDTPATAVKDTDQGIPASQKTEAAAPSQKTAGDAAKEPQAKVAPAKPDVARTEPAKTETAKAEPTAEDKWSYFLQTGAFRERVDAESARAKLALLGFEAKVSERPSDNGTLYRVRIGPIAQQEAVNRMRSKLSDSGVDAAIVRIAK